MIDMYRNERERLITVVGDLLSRFLYHAYNFNIIQCREVVMGQLTSEHIKLQPM